VLTPEQIRTVELAAFAAGWPQLALMEEAGRQVAEAAAKRFGVQGIRYLILCGPGNNGADGLVAGRYLHTLGAPVEAIVLLRGKTTEAFDQQLKIFQAIGLAARVCSEGAVPEDAFARADVVIDGLLGSGFRPPLKLEFLETIRALNTAAKPVISIDIPSGVDGETGQVATQAVKAQITVALGCYQPGVLLFPGAGHAGEVVLTDLGLADEMYWGHPNLGERMTEHQARQLLPKRPPESHKGTFGPLAVFAGSPGFTGAAELASRAALRAGAGVVTLFTPELAATTVSQSLVEVMVRALPGSTWDNAGLPEILGLARAVVLGPGMGRGAAVKELVLRAVGDYDVAAVLDADALNAVAPVFPNLFSGRTTLPVVTPHPGEMARLTGTSVQAVEQNRWRAAQTLARELPAVVVLKGAPTVVASPDGYCCFNSTGSNLLATAGSGDVLSGIIGGLLAQGMGPGDAARLGVYLHGMAADLWERDNGRRGMIAGDLIEMLPRVYKELEEV
jgi:NAD(P)H-hydrate epimerase